MSISVSTLNQEPSQALDNISNLTEYNHQLNMFAAVQEYLMMFIDNLTIAKIDSIILQGSTLSQLTAVTNQLTRNSLVK